MQENTSAKDTVARTSKTFVIKGCYYKDNCLPSLNDLLHEAERHPMSYNRLKKQMETVVINAIRSQLRGWKAETKIRLDITWGEKNKGAKRDYDNVVAAGRKIINDSLTKSGTITDDNPRYMAYGQNEFVYVEHPFIEVSILAVSDEL